MELVHGSSVNGLLRAVTAHGATVPLDVALHIALQTARALGHAHRVTDDNGEALQIVHRDVSPANILLAESGHVKLADFGIARAIARDARTEQGHVRGKLGYMSPEQVMGKPLDGRTDVFTLSTVLAEMLVGEPLFGDGSDLDVLLRIRDVDLRVLDRTARQIPKDVQELMRQGLTRNITLRPTAAAFAELLSEVILRRGISRSPERLSRLLSQLDLLGVQSESDRVPVGTRPTALVETHRLTSDTQKMVADLSGAPPSQYRVRMPDGKLKGPMSFPRLIQMITSGEVDGRTEICKDDGPFGQAVGLSELTRFVTSPALQWSTDEISTAEQHGDLAGENLLSVIHDIAARQRTGVLHLRDGKRRKKIYFVDGRPEFVASTDHSELLGEHLVAHGMCLRMEVEMALALLPRYGGRLGDALVGLGVLRPVALFRAISDQVRSRFLEAFRWKQGEWAFAPGVESHEEIFPLGHDINELIRDGAFEVEKRKVDAVLDPVRQRVIVRTPVPPVPMNAYRLSSSWQRMLNGVRGDTTFERIVEREAESFGTEQEDIHRAFFLGLSCALIHPA